ncbi:hypothetical protein EJ05DRAFT_504160 [Pseudovirgaria hyperparasitica]|uniref:RNI-like protein n=1 Tax=Pseudovirgaria hyperparasitica TaxID=470096 RepID=A0A6A6VY49_9PEZI|nr:uncharacterized protein EJ05DRAFT_504160 [Pseudovirgaria hyperparasitica]KAF2754634.1 hypothetical protein EJ05DRAFT_504160 [Pseudovirgaria hyperparasitica]
MSAVDQALGQRVILSNILLQLTGLELVLLKPAKANKDMIRGSPSLLPCLLVNKLWADEATRLLWSHRAKLESLLKIDVTRRQYYASNVRSIEALSSTGIQSHQDTVSLDSLNSLDWPCLKEFTMHISANARSSDFQDFHPFQDRILRVKAIKVNDEPELELNNTVRMSAAGNKPSGTQSLEVSESEATAAVSASHRAHEIIKFLEDHPKINQVSIHCTILTRVPELVDYLAQKANLESLSILLDHCEPMRMFKPGSFPALKSLEYAGRLDTLTNLVPLLNSLQSLRLTAMGNLGISIDQTAMDNFLYCLCSLGQLQTLRLQTKIWGLLSSTQLVLKAPLLALFAQACQNLRILDIDVGNGPDASSVTDEDMGQIARALPRLEQFHLPMKPWLSKLTYQGMRLLGQHCRRLESLHLGANISLEGLSTESSTLLPNLRSFMLGIPSAGMHTLLEPEDKILPLLDIHIPKLETVLQLRSSRTQDQNMTYTSGSYGLFCVEPSTKTNCIGTNGSGSNVLLARTSYGELPKLAVQA